MMDSISISIAGSSKIEPPGIDAKLAKELDEGIKKVDVKLAEEKARKEAEAIAEAAAAKAKVDAEKAIADAKARADAEAKLKAEAEARKSLAETLEAYKPLISEKAVADVVNFMKIYETLGPEAKKKLSQDDVVNAVKQLAGIQDTEVLRSELGKVRDAADPKTKNTLTSLLNEFPAEKRAEHAPAQSPGKR